jgi:predicted ATPase
MILYTLIPFISFLASLSSAIRTSLNSIHLRPINLTKVNNLIKYKLNLNTTPLAPYGKKQIS